MTENAIVVPPFSIIWTLKLFSLAINLVKPITRVNFPPSYRPLVRRFLGLRRVAGFQGFFQFGGTEVNFSGGTLDDLSCIGLCTYWRRTGGKRRSAEIAIAKQPEWYETAYVTFHELLHAAIWLLRLPTRWNDSFVHRWF